MASRAFGVLAAGARNLTEFPVASKGMYGVRVRFRLFIFRHLGLSKVSNRLRDHWRFLSNLRNRKESLELDLLLLSLSVFEFLISRNQVVSLGKTLL
jgi:hypothetical protein